MKILPPSKALTCIAQNNVEKAEVRINVLKDSLSSYPPEQDIDTRIKYLQTDIRTTKRNSDAVKRELSIFTNS